MAYQSFRLTKILDLVLENGSIQVEEIETLLGAVSYTHLTLPTNREV